MQLAKKVIVITGAASGIGRALAIRFAREKPRGVVVTDVDEAGCRKVAETMGGMALRCDVSREEELKNVVDRTLAEFGQIDLFCSNAGIVVHGGVEVPDEEWQRILNVNFMSHVYAARAVLPGMLERGEGYLLHTASAAGLLTQIGSAPYSVTKHAVVSLAEWLAVTHGDQGIRVSCLCPQWVKTKMLEGDPLLEKIRDQIIPPGEVADLVVASLAEERFLILPHPEVHEFLRRKADDHDRWLRGMRRLQAKWQ